MEGLRNILDSIRGVFTNDLNFFNLSEGLTPAVYIILVAFVLLLLGFLVAVIIANTGKMKKFKQQLDDTTAYVNATGFIDEENVEGVYSRISAMPRSVSDGWSNFMEQQTGKPSDYIPEKEVLGSKKSNPNYAPGKKFITLFGSIIVLLTLLLCAICYADAFYTMPAGWDGLVAVTNFVLPVVGTIAIPAIIYLIFKAILSGINSSKFKKLRASFIKFQDALDSNVIIFREEQDDFITENIEEINAAIEDILANKLKDSEILEIVTTPVVQEIYETEEIEIEEEEPVAVVEKPIVEEEEPVEPIEEEQVIEEELTEEEKEIRRGERLVQLVFIADAASKDDEVEPEQLEELAVFLEEVRTSGEYDDPDEQAIFIDCLTIIAGAYAIKFPERME
ncbi:MAG TPA: hypothetical protein PKX91_06370 [Clostridia bacterium]|jgi:hypothetical protein|nr:hypothetical protein [Clostridia bacterium]